MDVNPNAVVGIISSYEKTQSAHDCPIGDDAERTGNSRTGIRRLNRATRPRLPVWSFNDQRRPAFANGRFIGIWKRQRDGSLKLAIDYWTSSRGQTSSGGTTRY